MTCFSIILCLGQSGRSGIKMNKFPRIKVDFIIEGNNLDLEETIKIIQKFQKNYSLGMYGVYPKKRIYADK